MARVEDREKAFIKFEDSFQNSQKHLGYNLVEFKLLHV